MQIINVDLIPGKVMPILHASQFDVGRSLGVKLYNGGAVYDLTGAEVVSVSVRKPDGNIVTEALTNSGGNELEIITTEQMTACAGASLCEIKIEDSGDVIGSANFVLEVEEDPLDGGIASQSEINNLATQVADLVSEQYDSANVIFDAVPTAGHGNGYTVTSEGIKDALDAINNPAASAVSYDNTASGLAATNVQDALDEAVDVFNDNFADAYDPTATYNTGDVCIYNNVLYICTEDNITGTFDPSKWTATTIDNIIGSLSTLTTTDKSSLVGAVNALDSAKANKATTLAGYGITNAYTKTEVDNNNARKYTTLWGTTCETTIGRAQFLVLTNRVLYVVWLASTNDINVANVSSNTYQSGTGNVTLDNNVFTRLSNNNLKVQLPGSGTITIFG